MARKRTADPRARGQTGEAYLAVNPMGEVPALEIDGILLTQSVSRRRAPTVAFLCVILSIRRAGAGRFPLWSIWMRLAQSIHCFLLPIPGNELRHGTGGFAGGGKPCAANLCLAGANLDGDDCIGNPARAGAPAEVVGWAAAAVGSELSVRCLAELAQNLRVLRKHGLEHKLEWGHWAISLGFDGA